MENKSDIILRKTKRMDITYFCEKNGKFNESCPLPDDVITDKDAYKYAFNCEKNLLLHHKKYPFCKFERRFFYQLSDGVVIAKNGDKNDTIVNYHRSTGNIFVNGELTTLYFFMASKYFKDMTKDGKDVFYCFLRNNFQLNLHQVSNIFNPSGLFIRFVVFKHEKNDRYNDYEKFKKGDIYKPFGLSEDKL